MRAAQLGLRTGLVERNDLGGVCLNLGCIPSKAMLHSAEVLSLAHGAPELGPSSGNFSGDYAAAVTRRDSAVSKLLLGLTNLLRGNNITVIRGEAQLVGPHTCNVNGADGVTSVRFENLIIATGSSPAPLPVEGANLPG